jgi:serine/threonine protein phosphatase PrpC
MRPVADPAGLQPGTTLYHSAFGFARVADVDSDAVRLTWERAGAHLPARVRFDNLRRVYSMCTPEGFFHRALKSPDALRHALLDRPADALVWLLDDLGGPQRVRDVMDWLVGREMFTPKTFVRWWGTVEPMLRADGRLSVDGEWIQLRESSPPTLVQLEPGLVAPEADTPEEVAPPPREERASRPLHPVSLTEASVPTSRFVEVGAALARSLAEAHGLGRLARPNATTARLHPSGRVELPPAPMPARNRSGDDGTPEDDVRDAGVALIEMLLGRSLPLGADPADVLPHLRHRAPTLPPSALAPLYEALRSSAEDRPTAAAWMAQWETIRQVEAERAAAGSAEATLVAGYDSHVGRVKLLSTQTNQDALWLAHRGVTGLFVIADGISLSDAGRGEQASSLVVQTLSRAWQGAADISDPRRFVGRTLALANLAVCEAARRAAGGNLEGRMPMGTTVTLALTAGNRVHLSWLGDSRAFLLGPWGVSQLTADDNVSGERLGAWCDGRARTWTADGHALVRYVGNFDGAWRAAPFAAHHATFVLRPDERLLLCTDGITDYVSRHEADTADPLHRLAAGGDPHEAARALVGLANARGGGDNATAIVIASADRPPDPW